MKDLWIECYNVSEAVKHIAESHGIEVDYVLEEVAKLSRNEVLKD
jgi:hypothetical protein